MSRILVLLLALALTGATGARAQSAANEGGLPPYEPELIHLAEILGALHFLRPLCGAPEAQRWRDEMQGLMDTEQPSDARRASLVSSFNRGYESYSQVYRACTPAAELAGKRYLDEGARLSRDIATRYGSN